MSPGFHTQFILFCVTYTVCLTAAGYMYNTADNIRCNVTKINIHVEVGPSLFCYTFLRLAKEEARDAANNNNSNTEGSKILKCNRKDGILPLTSMVKCSAQQVYDAL